VIPEPICGAIGTLENDLGNVVCARLPSQHYGLDHYDPDLGVHWPICPTYCGRLAGSTRHVCGEYRGDTAHRYDSHCSA